MGLDGVDVELAGFEGPRRGRLSPGISHQGTPFTWLCLIFPKEELALALVVASFLADVDWMPC